MRKGVVCVSNLLFVFCVLCFADSVFLPLKQKGTDTSLPFFFLFFFVENDQEMKAKGSEVVFV